MDMRGKLCSQGFSGRARQKTPPGDLDRSVRCFVETNEEGRAYDVFLLVAVEIRKVIRKEVISLGCQNDAGQFHVTTLFGLWQLLEAFLRLLAGNLMFSY